MTPILDPIWPWSYLWAVLVQVPPPIRVVALVAALVALAVPLLWLTGRRGLPLRVTAGFVVVCLALLLRHTWPVVYAEMAEGRSGFAAFLAAIGAQLALLALLLGPTLLVSVSVGTYLAAGPVSRRRIGLMIGLRLLAFLLALVAVARPALARFEDERTQTHLFVAVDRSRSMTVLDERGKQSRWEVLLRSLRAASTALARLRDEQGVEVKFFGFGETTAEFDVDAPGEPDGKRTDVGGMLRALFDQRDARRPIRGLLVLSDGADNGGVPALAEAARWNNQGVAIHTFASGNPGTTPKQNDAAITAIATSPQPFVPVKGKLTVKLTIDARGYENSKARVRLFLESRDDKGEATDREVLARDVPLPLTTGNEVTMTVDAPDRPGEVKVKAVLETNEPDDLPLNNVIETFVTVSREGLSVLLVDRQRAFEPQLICDALAQDARIRVTPVWVRGGTRGGKLLNFDEQPFDVILLGDVTAEALRSLDSDALGKIERHVARGGGLMVLGGYVNLGNRDWKGTELEKLLPVDLSARGQEEAAVRMVPTEDGLRRAPYLLRLDDTTDPREAWSKLAKLDGATTLQLPEPRRGLETVLASTPRGEPLLVTQTYGGKSAADPKKPDGGAGRVLVFAGDTTYRWVRNEEGQRMHARFWRQAVVWLAHQEDAEGSIYVKPDVRRLPVRTDLGFQVGVRGKGGGPDLIGGTFEAELTAPDGTKTRVPVSRSVTATRGTVTGLTTPGVYRISVRGEAKDTAGGTVSGEASARVIVYDEDLELTRPAADPEFLQKLAAASGGEALRIEQLADFLNRLAERPVERAAPRTELRPDWRTTARSSFFPLYFVVFTLVVCLEWGLRRRWGLV